MIETNAVMQLWKLGEIPFCPVGIELTKTFLQKSLDAVTELHSMEAVMPLRNAMIRAHRDLVDHRSTCPDCNASDGVEKLESDPVEGRKILYMPDHSE